MKIERTKNAARNIVFGILLKIQQILMPFLMRTVMVYYMGVQYLGLNSLFASILQVLNLAELGVGSAMVYSMYKPIVEDDTDKICALMNLYKKYYRIIGLIIAVVGIILTPFIPKLVKGDIPNELNIYFLYFLNLSATVLSYWLFAYKGALLQAHQRVDISSKVSIATSTLQFIIQIFILLSLHDYYLYVIVSLVVQVLNNIIVAVFASKLYPKYKAYGRLLNTEVEQINRKVRDLFTSKIGAIIVNSADSIVISSFLGLTTLAIYQNYYFILVSIIGFVSIAFTSCTAGIGNSIITETKEKNFKDLIKFTFLLCWVSTFCSCCFLNLYQPFMQIWVGKDLMLHYSAVICFVIYYFVYEINQLLNLYKDAAGIWHEDRFRPLITALSNLFMNVIMVQIWGIYGVLLSTVISTLFIGMPWLFHNLFSTIFDKNQMFMYLKKLAKYCVVAVLTCIICGLICSRLNFNIWTMLFVRLFICIIVPNILLLIIYHNLPEFYDAIILVDKMTNEKLHLSKLFCKDKG